MTVVPLHQSKARLRRVQHQYELRLGFAHFFFGCITFTFGVIGAAIAAYDFYQHGSENQTKLFIHFLTISIVCLLITTTYILFLRRKLKKSAIETQKDRNRFASEVIKARGRNTESGFSLYIRPFIIDGQIATAIKFHNVDFFSGLLDERFESALTRAIDHQFPVVALGGEPLQFGPGGVAVPDDEWEKCVLELMEAASLIIVIPIAQQSTLWEIRQIHWRGLLHKTVFVVPPLSGHTNTYLTAIGCRSMQDIYGYSHEQFNNYGIPMPKMGLKGGIFWLHEDTKTLRIWRYRHFKALSHVTFRTIRKVILVERNSKLLPEETFRSLDDAVSTSEK